MIIFVIVMILGLLIAWAKYYQLLLKLFIGRKSKKDQIRIWFWFSRYDFYFTKDSQTGLIKDVYSMNDEKVDDAFVRSMRKNTLPIIKQTLVKTDEFLHVYTPPKKVSCAFKCSNSGRYYMYFLIFDDMTTGTMIAKISG